jgi:transcriptional regulator with XRE-family HTH domain
MDSINERIKHIRSVLNISQIEFSKKIFVSQSTYGEIELGNRKVNDRIIHLISTEFNINKDWILTGNGEIFNIEKPDLDIQNLVEMYKQLDKPLQDYLLKQTELLIELNNKI